MHIPPNLPTRINLPDIDKLTLNHPYHSAGIALIVRIPFVRRLAITPNFLHETVYVAFWSFMEPSLGIIAGCVATLRPLFKGLGFGKRTTQLNVSSRYGASGDSDHRRGGNSPRSIGEGGLETGRSSAV